MRRFDTSKFRGWKITYASLGNRLYSAHAKKGDREITVSLMSDAYFVPEEALASMARVAIKKAEEDE